MYKSEYKKTSLLNGIHIISLVLGKLYLTSPSSALSGNMLSTYFL